MVSGHLALFFNKFGVIFDGPFEPISGKTGSLRCRGWILRVEDVELGVSRAPGDVWEPISGHVGPEV